MRTDVLLANTYVLGIIDGTYVGMCEDTGTIYTETSGVYCMNPHKELIIHIKDTVIQYPYIVPVSSHIPHMYIMIP